MGHTRRTGWVILMGQDGAYAQDRSGYTHREGRVIWSGQVGLYSWGRSGHMVRTDRAILMGQVGLTRRTSLPIFDVFSEESGVV